MTKDLSDCIALMDPNYGRIDIGLLKSLIDSYQLTFLKQTIIELPTETESISQYRASKSTEIEGWVDMIASAFD